MGDVTGMVRGGVGATSVASAEMKYLYTSDVTSGDAR